MRKIVLIIWILFVQSSFSQITLTPFTPNIGHTAFTQSLDVSLNEIVVFSGYAHDLSQSRVVVFEKNGTNLTQETYFTSPDAAPYDNFGLSVSIDSDFIAAGSPLNDQAASNAGAVYLYRKVAGNWEFFQKITAFDGTADDNFGSTVKVKGNQLFVAAINDELVGQPTSTNAGSVYVYNFNGTNWVFSEKLTVPSPYQFGRKIEVENNTMVISSSTVVSTYSYNGTNWVFVPSAMSFEPLTDFELNDNHLFILMNSVILVYNAGTNAWDYNSGLSNLNLDDKYPTNFVVKNNLMFISLNSHSLLYTARTPVAVYRKISGTWTFQEYIYGQGPSDRDDSFGTKMAKSDDIVVIGAPNEFLPTADGGRAYTFDVALGVNENSLSAIKLYPNPTSGLLTLSDDLIYEISFIDIYQYDGKLIKSIKSSFDTISLSEFQNGVYLLKLTLNNGSSVTRKIVKI